MSIYPRVVIYNPATGTQLLDATDSLDRWGIDPSCPPRATAMPQYVKTVSQLSGNLIGTQMTVPAQLFTLTLVMVGRGSSIDARHADLEDSIAIWSQTVGALSSYMIQYFISSGSDRYATARAQSFDVERINLDAARVTIVFDIPEGLWRSSSEITTTEQTNFVNLSYHTLGTTAADSGISPGTGPIYDIKFRLKGPVINPQIIASGSGDRVSLGSVTLASTDYWFFNAATFDSRISTSSTAWTSGGTATTTHFISTSDSILSSAFRVGVELVSANRYHRLQLANATGTTSATSFAVKYKRSWY